MFFEINVYSGFCGFNPVSYFLCTKIMLQPKKTIAKMLAQRTFRLLLLFAASSKAFPKKPASNERFEVVEIDDYSGKFKN